MRGELASCAGDAGDGEVRRGSFLRGIHRGAGGAGAVGEQGIYDGSVCKAEHDGRGSKSCSRGRACRAGRCGQY